MMQNFSETLRIVRAKAGLTQAELAERAGLSRKQISDYESKSDIKPRRQNLEKLAKALSVDVDVLDINNTDPVVTLTYGNTDQPKHLGAFKIPTEIYEYFEEISATTGKRIDEVAHSVIKNSLKTEMQAKINELRNTQDPHILFLISVIDALQNQQDEIKRILES